MVTSKRVSSLEYRERGERIVARDCTPMHEGLYFPGPQAFTVLGVNLHYSAFHIMLEFYLLSDNCEGLGDQAFEG